MPAGPDPDRLSAGSGRGGMLALAALVLGRTSVSFQFQSVTPLMPALSQALGLTPTGFGLLLGLYMAPGAAMAIALPALMSRIGRAGTLLLALALMALGQFGLLFATSPEQAYAARLVAGIGGCIIYISTVGLAAQLAHAGPLPRRMGAIAASWPFGNAVALVALSALAGAGAAATAASIPVAAIVMAALLIALMLRMESAGEGDAGSGRAGGASLAQWRQALARSFPVAASFALYNVGFILLTSFSPQLLASQGYTPAAAAAVSSLPMWLFIVSVPGGGLLAGRAASRDRLLVGLGCLGGGLCILISLAAADKALWYGLAGLIGGLPTAPMLAAAGRGDSSAAGAGLVYAALFLVFFIALLIFPPLVGALVDWTGNMRVAAGFSIALMVSAFMLFIGRGRLAPGAV